MSRPILPTDPKAGYLAHKAEIDGAIQRVLDSGWYILGGEARAFEAEFAAYVGVNSGVGVGSGTDALHLGLRALGVGPGDEVITVSHTAVATVAAIELAGATPVLVDIDPVTYTISPDAVRAVLTPRTRVLLPVHLYGHPADLGTLLEIAQQHGLRVFEDCAQCHGATYQGRRTGAWGDLAAFSFYPTKNLGALGDGGLLAANDPQLIENARLIREYGWRERYISEVAGFNTRLDELQAAILRARLVHLEADNARRQAIAARYTAGLADTGLVLPVEVGEVTHVYHQYVVRSPQRDGLREGLRERGVGSLIHYPVPIHRQPAYEGRVRVGASMAETERAAREIVSLPIYPELGDDQVDAVIEALRTLTAA